MNKRIVLFAFATLLAASGIGGTPIPNVLATNNTVVEVPPMITNPAVESILFEGLMQERINNSIDNWLLPAYRSNPAMIEMFRQRDAAPRLKIVSWYGEFPGKHLTAASLLYRLTKREDIKAEMDGLVEALESVQSEEGYLGPFPESERLVGYIHKDMGKHRHWDMWGHYHCIMGLLMWHEETGNKTAYEVAVKAADYVISYFEHTGKNVLEAGETEMNLSIVHAYTTLYQLTREQKYLDFAQTLLRALEDETAGDYYRAGLANTAFYQTRKPRWEGLHTIQALYDMFLITGEESFRVSFENLWWSILETDRHNTGGFSSGEQAQGSPYHTGPIETCCTVAWIALSCDMYHLTQNPLIIDELELSTLNGVLGYMHPSGRWSAYNSPMLGVKKASAHEIVFQAVAGSPELNCCSVNAPRGLGMIADWAVLRTDEGVALNYYGAGEIHTATPKGNTLVIAQKTEYPKDGAITIRLSLTEAEEFTLRLRIPAWSNNTQLAVNGQPLSDVRPGTYYDLTRLFSDGDTLSLSLDMSLHFWAGEEVFAGSAAIYYGPLLMTYDTRYNAKGILDVPALSLADMSYRIKDTEGTFAPMVLMEFTAAQGEPVMLLDYASAGVNGTSFNTWIPLEGIAPAVFDRDKAVWITRP